MQLPACWVMSAHWMPCGARQLGDLAGRARPGTTWLEVNTLGQHLPQMYPAGDIRPLTAQDCPRLGLCPTCLGFGNLDTRPPASWADLARAIDQAASPCPDCGGTGRPALRVTIRRDGSGMTGEIRPLPHAYVPPLDTRQPELAATFGVTPDACLACGTPPDGTGPRGEALHQ